MTRLLIDADMLLHRSCIAVEKDTRFLGRYHILMSDEHEAWNVLENTLADLTDCAGTDDVLMVFSDPETTFRKQWFPKLYKDNRAGYRKPLAYWSVKERMCEAFPHDERPLLEADDLLGILATETTGDIIWSLDKDLKQIPGLHLMDDDVCEISQEEADFFFYFQTLAGDTVDGYLGAPGVGEKQATTMLRNKLKTVPYEHTLASGKRKGEVEVRYKDEPAENPWETVVSLFEKAGQSEVEALQNAQMAKILRSEDYQNGKVIQWMPK